MAKCIGKRGDDRLDPDPTTTPGECECGGKTWPNLDDDSWQCEDCGEIYEE